MQILQSVIEQKGVGFHFTDSEKPALHAIFVHEHDHVLQILREHVRFVAGLQRIEKKIFAIGNDAWWIDMFVLQFVQPAALARTRHTFVTASQDGDAPAAGLQSAGKLFHDRRFACASDSEIADADDEAAKCALAKKALAVEKQTQLHDALVDKGKAVEQAAQKSRAHAMTPLENDVDGKLLEIFEACHLICAP